MSEVFGIGVPPLEPYLSGSTEPWSVSVIQALIRLKKPANLIELGTYEGKTTVAMANAMSHLARLWTVDATDHGTYFGDDHRIIKVIRDAEDWLENVAPTGVIDFAFVDDDHERAHVDREIRILKEKIMAPGGWIVMHDVIGDFDLASVCIAHGGFVIELPLLHRAGGLGVIVCE